MAVVLFALAEGNPLSKNQFEVNEEEEEEERNSKWIEFKVANKRIFQKIFKFFKISEREANPGKEEKEEKEKKEKKDKKGKKHEKAEDDEADTAEEGLQPKDGDKADVSKYKNSEWSPTRFWKALLKYFITLRTWS